MCKIFGGKFVLVEKSWNVVAITVEKKGQDLQNLNSCGFSLQLAYMMASLIKQKIPKMRTKRKILKTLSPTQVGSLNTDSYC